MITEPYVAKSADGREYLAVASGIDVAWARRVWETHAAPGTARISIVRFPGDAGAREAVVKVYRRRVKHGLLRRWLTSRAAREARGYEAFARRGMLTAGLLFWGEARRFGLLTRSIIVTARVDAEPVHVAYGRTRDERLLEGALDALLAMHRAGLCHGDPRLRNFLATDPAPTAIDLASWAPAGRRARLRDLTRFLGSVMALTGGPDVARGLLERYAAGGVRLPCSARAIIARAERYVRKEGRP